ncbi:MAG: PilX N-terminal domain-containing pilus assembly protein [Kangiellaceae bacterium]|nr:PilX N-terminal domain-containing pilus assembly protein [Kangiellaceae bacterium]
MKIQFSQQSGAALFVSLIMLLILTIVGLSAAQRGSLQEKVAANVHMEHMAFNAAESAIGSFMIEAATGDSAQSGHVLYEVRTTNTVTDRYFNNAGSRVSSGYIDSDHGSDVHSIITPSVAQDCSTSMCGGFSLGTSNSAAGVGCRIYQLDAQGSVGPIGTPVKSVSTSTWAYEVTICRN